MDQLEGVSTDCGTAFKACDDLQKEGEIVYLVKCGDFVKIGYTLGMVEARVKSFMTASPHEFEVLLKLPGGCKLEKRLHSIFKDYHHRGEWFRLSGSLLEFVTSAAKVDWAKRRFRRSRKSPVQRMTEELEKCSLLNVCEA